MLQLQHADRIVFSWFLEIPTGNAYSPVSFYRVFTNLLCMTIICTNCPSIRFCPRNDCNKMFHLVKKSSRKVLFATARLGTTLTGQPSSSPKHHKSNIKPLQMSRSTSLSLRHRRLPNALYVPSSSPRTRIGRPAAQLPHTAAPACQYFRRLENAIPRQFTCFCSIVHFPPL
jgi:hypothetical protein